MPTTLTNPTVLYHFGDDHLLLTENEIIYFETHVPPRIPPFTLNPTRDLSPSNTWADVLTLNGRDTLNDRYQLQALIHRHANPEAIRLSEELIGSEANLQHLALITLNMNAIKQVHPATAAAFLHLEVDHHGYRAMINPNELPRGYSTSDLHERLITLLRTEQQLRE